MENAPEKPIDQKESLGRLAFKEVAGTAMGALALCGMGAGIAAYRGAGYAGMAKTALGMAAFGAPILIGSGNMIYDDTFGRFAKKSFVERVQNPRPDGRSK